jgi:TolA-binding protein
MEVAAHLAVMRQTLLTSLTVTLLAAAPCVAVPAPSPAGGSPAPAQRPPGETAPDGYTLPDLPDGGPRDESPLDGPDAERFAQGVESYRRGRLPLARAAFAQVLKGQPSGPTASAARAFLAEIQVAERPGSTGLTTAIDAYRALAQELPDTPNGRRARWRIGDLYAALGLRVEAQGTYERALAELPEGPDADRALLGLAVNAVEGGKLPEAERALAQLRRRTEDETLLSYATLWLADVLAAARRPVEAEALYRTVLDRWPDFLKRRPGSLLRYAGLAMELGLDERGRCLYLLAYNLRPRSGAAPEMLVSIGDSFRRGGDPVRAARFYDLAAARHPGTLGEALARLRLAELGQDLLAADPEQALRRSVRALVGAGPVPDLDPARQRRLLRETADAHRDLVLGSEALFHLAAQQQVEGDREAAGRTYEELLERAGRVPDDPWPERGSRRFAALLEPEIRLALARGEDLAALTLARRLGVFAERVFAGGDLLLRLADASRRVGWLSEAVRLYQATLKDRGAQTWREEALFGLGTAYVGQGDFRAARQVFDRYRIQYPLGRRTPEVLRLLAEAALDAGDPAAAAAACDRWLARYPDDPARPLVLALSARALVEAGERERGLRRYDEAERAGALVEPAALLRYADLLAAAGRGEAALARYGRALQADPAGAGADWARWQIARIHRARGDRASAEVALDALLSEAADPVTARLALAAAADLHEGGGRDDGPRRD